MNVSPVLRCEKEAFFLILLKFVILAKFSDFHMAKITV